MNKTQVSLDLEVFTDDSGDVKDVRVVQFSSQGKTETVGEKITTNVGKEESL
jgi:hypothetical protein